MRKLLVFLLLLTAAGVWANPAELIDEGEYRAAYQEALAMGGAEGYALAAQAASYYAGFKATTDREKEEWYGKAEEAAKKAIELDPDYPDGYFELARAQGRLAQYRGILASLGLASSVRDNLNKVLELKPDADEAMVALAIWNLELAQKGVGWMYGASIGRVVPLFEKAISLNPTSIAHRLEYGNALIRLKKPAEARVQLEKALELPAKTYADRMNQEKARKLLEELR
ncbi:tetratricopeptide repeat protein [Oceanithermus sp.]